MSSRQAAPLNILYLDNHLIAVAKPAGALTQSGNKDAPSLLEMTREWIRKKYGKPGNVYLGLIHRLDRNVAGLVLFARTSKAAGRLSKQFRERAVQKYYRAAVEGTPENKKGALTHYLRKEKSLKSTVFPRPAPGAKKAEMVYNVAESSETTSILEIELKTGRFHQIRAQLSFLGHPVIGDVKYGASAALPGKQIALYASRLVFRHPVSGEETCVECPPPERWSNYAVGNY